MKPLALARLSACLLLGLSPAVLGNCGGATNSGSRGTETGNPPVVDSKKLRLVAGGADVELIGQPGAVSPGAQVRLDNLGTGATATVTANPDGSFRVEVTGSAADTYQATVTHEGNTVTVPVSFARSDADAGASSDPGDPRCEALRSGLDSSLREAYAPFATGCTRDSECELSWWSEGCYSGCGYGYVLKGQEAAASTAGQQSLAAACSELESRGCQQLEPPVCNAGAPSPMCHQGTCQGMDLNPLSCEDLEARAGQLLSEVQENVDRTCNADADCIVTSVAGVSCRPDCGLRAAIATGALAGLGQAIANIEDSVCSTFAERSCTPALPPSCPMPEATVTGACVDNRCGEP